MRRTILILAAILSPFSFGCNRFVMKTFNRVVTEGVVDTRVEATPVSPAAGPLRPVVVQNGAGRVAILDVDGILLNYPFTGPMSLGENPVATFREKLEAVGGDRCVKAVVLRVNSHGGGVAASQAMRRDLERFKAQTRLPVVACLMDNACGGAYVLASAADQVVANPATVTGGVGVILNLFNLQDLMAQFNVIPQPVLSGKQADIGTSARVLTPDEKKLLQAMSDELHAQLAAEVRRSRPQLKDPATVFDGRILTASQALAHGLVDRVGDLDEAICAAAQMGNGGADRPQVVLYRRANDPAHSIYAVTANVPLQAAGLLPNLPGLDRTKMPTFLSMWQPELTMEKLGGR
jgi:protease-4